MEIFEEAVLKKLQGSPSRHTLARDFNCALLTITHAGES